MSKKVYVACGGAVATSTVAAGKVEELIKREGLDAEVIQCRISELSSNADDAAVFVTTAKVSRDYGVPVVHGVSFITGINTEKAEQQVIEALKD